MPKTKPPANLIAAAKIMAAIVRRTEAEEREARKTAEKAIQIREKAG